MHMCFTEIEAWKVVYEKWQQWEDVREDAYIKVLTLQANTGHCVYYDQGRNVVNISLRRIDVNSKWYQIIGFVEEDIHSSKNDACNLAKISFIF